MNKLTEIVLLLLSYNVLGSELPGHMERLGMQHPSEGHIDILEEIPDPLTFHEKYIAGSRPCVFKGAAKAMPAFQNWSDDYLKENYGTLKMDIEEGKKENRSMPAYRYTMKDFVEKYNSENIYLVHSIQKPMRGDVQLLPCLSCGGFTKVMQDIVMWFSSGGTSSVLHFDMIDNINCLFSGTKELFMVDKKHEDTIPMDHESGSYSYVDVDAVDLDKYPSFAKIPWFEAKMEAGDCLFIPMQWYHQVRSAGRNIAVNVWFTSMPVINETDCAVNKDSIGFVPLDKLELKSPEGIRTILGNAVGEKGLHVREFKVFVQKHCYTINRKGLKRLVRLADVDGDKTVTLDDISKMTMEALEDYRRLTYFGYSDEEAEPEEEEGEEPPKDEL